MSAQRFNYHYDGFGAYYLCDTQEGEYEDGIIGEIWADKSDMINLVKLLNQLYEENQDLRQFKAKTFDLLDKYLEEYPYLTLSEKWDAECKYKHSCRKNHSTNVAYASRNILLRQIIKDLKK